MAGKLQKQNGCLIFFSFASDKVVLFGKFQGIMYLPNRKLLKLPNYDEGDLTEEGW
jgi:hypothetical protein